MVKYSTLNPPPTIFGAVLLSVSALLPVATVGRPAPEGAGCRPGSARAGRGRRLPRRDVCSPLGQEDVKALIFIVTVIQVHTPDSGQLTVPNLEPETRVTVGGTRPNPSVSHGFCEKYTKGLRFSIEIVAIRNNRNRVNSVVRSLL